MILEVTNKELSIGKIHIIGCFRFVNRSGR